MKVARVLDLKYTFNDGFIDGGNVEFIKVALSDKDLNNINKAQEFLRDKPDANFVSLIMTYQVDLLDADKLLTDWDYKIQQQQIMVFRNACTVLLHIGDGSIRVETEEFKI